MPYSLTLAPSIPQLTALTVTGQSDIIQYHHDNMHTVPCRRGWIEARLDADEVAAGLQEAGDVKLCRQAAVLAVPHGLAVHPHVERIVHAVKLQENPAPECPEQSLRQIVMQAALRNGTKNTSKNLIAASEGCTCCVASPQAGRSCGGSSLWGSPLAQTGR